MSDPDEDLLATSLYDVRMYVAQASERSQCGRHFAPRTLAGSAAVPTSAKLPMSFPACLAPCRMHSVSSTP
jgi:hypothetical protein